MPGTIQPADGYVVAGHSDQTAINGEARILVDPTLYKRAPQDAPLSYTVSKFRRKTSKLGKDMQLKFHEIGAVPQHDVVAVRCDAGATSFGATHGEYFSVRNTLWKHESSGMQFIVRVKPTGDTVTIVPGYGDTAAAAMEVGDVVTCLGPDRAEGQEMQDMMHTNTEEFYNLVNTMSYTVGITHHAELVEGYFAQDRMSRDMDLLMEKMARDREYRMWFGEKKAGTYDSSDATMLETFGKPTAAKGWVAEGFFPQHAARSEARRVKSWGGAITMNSFIDDFIAPWVYRAGVSDQLVLMHGQIVGLFLGKAKFQLVEYRPADTEFNLNLTTVKIAGKNITLMYNPALNAPPVGTGHKGERLVGLDMSGPHCPQFIEIEGSHLRKPVLDRGIDANARETYEIWSLRVQDANNHMVGDEIYSYSLN